MAQKKTGSSGKLIKFLITAVIIFGAGFLVIKNGDIIGDYFVALDYKPSAEIAAMVSELELTDEGMRIMKASLPEVQSAETFNNNCTSSDSDTSVLGCYSQRRVYIYEVENEELNGVQQSTLAHELLHAVWERRKNDDIAAELLMTYEQHRSELDEHMSHYDEASKVDELHSVIGTQLHDDDLSEKLQTHYQKYFKNRAKIVEYYRQYEEKFTRLEQRNAELKEKIDDMTSDIQVRSTQYENDAATLNRDIDVFNSHARNGYYSNNASFTADRNRLLARQSQLSRDYDDINAKIDEVNQLIEEYNANVSHSNELYSSINSKISAPDEALGQ